MWCPPPLFGHPTPLEVVMVLTSLTYLGWKILPHPASPSPEGWEEAFCSGPPCPQMPQCASGTSIPSPRLPSDLARDPGRGFHFHLEPRLQSWQLDNTVPSMACPPFTLALGMGTIVGSSSLLPSQS